MTKRLKLIAFFDFYNATQEVNLWKHMVVRFGFHKLFLASGRVGELFICLIVVGMEFVA